MKFTKHLFIYLFVFVFPTESVFSQSVDKTIAGISLERLKTYERYLNKSIQDGEIPEAVSMIVRNGQVVHYKAFGSSHVKDKTPMTTESLFYIQSMTKPIITVAWVRRKRTGS